MRKVTLAILAIFALTALAPGSAFAQAQEAAKPAQTQSLAEAARKIREKKKAQGQTAPKVYTNDNIPTTGGVSVIGAVQDTSTSQAANAEGGQEAQSTGCNEECWRGKFAQARKQLADAEKELDILQRELNLKQTQYYSDPQKAMNEQHQRTEINEHRAKIDAKQAEVAAMKKAIDDLETELRQAGGSPGWSRP